MISAGGVPLGETLMRKALLSLTKSLYFFEIIRIFN